MDLIWQRDPNNSKLFVDIFKHVLNTLTHQEYLGVLAPTIGRRCSKKDDKQSASCREEGNVEFKKKKWDEAMNLYNESLCFAEINSENISLAYANRSACFLHLKMYDKCLTDIELAIQARCPAHLVSKLEARRVKCVKEMETDDPIEKYLPNLSYEADENFPGMAKVLEIKYNKKFGRHIVAKCNIPTGKTVLVEEAIISGSKDMQYDKCSVCLKSSMNFIACSQCTNELFCDSTCENVDHVRKIECEENIPATGTDIEFHIRTILMAINIFTDIESLMAFVEEAINEKMQSIPHSLSDTKSKYRALLQLCNFVGKKKKAEYFELGYATFYALLMRKSIKEKFETERKIRFLMHLVLHHRNVISSNGFSTTDNRALACVISSYFNHACASNIFIFSAGNVRFGVTSRPIKANQQLFVTYLGDLFCDLPVDYCQTFLDDAFGFRCECERCKPNHRAWMRNSDLMQADPEYQFLNREVETWLDSGEGKTSAKVKLLYEKLVKIINRYGDQHWCDELASLIESFGSFF